MPVVSSCYLTFSVRNPCLPFCWLGLFILSKPRLNSFPAYAVSLAYLDYRWRFAVAFHILPGRPANADRLTKISDC